MNLSWKILVAIGSLFAASDEWHQSFIPGRDASVLDWISDCVGILGTLFLIHKFISLRNTEQKKR